MRGGRHGAERENAGQKKSVVGEKDHGVRRGGCKVHDGRRVVYVYELARVRLPSANRMIMACIEERALERWGGHSGGGPKLRASIAR